MLLNRGAVNVSLPLKASADILTIRETANRYRAQMENDRVQYLQQGFDPRSFESWYAKAHPLIEFAKDNAPRIQEQLFSAMGLKVPQSAPARDDALDAAMKKYGRKRSGQ